MAEWRPSLFSKNWTFLKKIIISSFLFIIYIHNELKYCSSSWNVSGYLISVIFISVFGHQGASICLKVGTNLNIIIPVHNLHAQWIANLWQIMKSIRVQHFSHINFCIWPPGGTTCLKIGKNHTINLYTMNCNLVANHEIYQGPRFR